MTEPIALDTSVAIPLLVQTHMAHRAVVSWWDRRPVVLSGHAVAETYSVLTRLPSPARRDPSVVEQILRTGFPATRFLGADDARALLGRLAPLGIAGGAVYDALVGQVAVAHRLAVATRDARAVDVYRALDVDVELID